MRTHPLRLHRDTLDQQCPTEGSVRLMNARYAHAALVHARITTRPAVAQSSIAQSIAVQRGVMSNRPERRAQKSTANAQWSTLSKKHPPTLIAGYGHDHAQTWELTAIEL